MPENKKNMTPSGQAYGKWWDRRHSGSRRNWPGEGVVWFSEEEDGHMGHYAKKGKGKGDTLPAG